MNFCKACEQALVLELDPEDFDEATSSAVGGASSAVPDDVELSCACHFHWQCLLDESPTIAVNLSCPSCRSPLASQPTDGPSATNMVLSSATQEPVIEVRYINEGGLQPCLNILPLITEEAYLDINPSARPARAYLTMCGEGDVGGIVELLQNLSTADEEEGEAGTMSLIELLRYQDPLDGMKSGLHVAVAKNQMETVWLLLWLASGMNSNHFPQQAVNAAQSMGAEREIANLGVDIRTLKNAENETAGHVAERCGGVMLELVRAGFL